MPKRAVPLSVERVKRAGPGRLCDGAAVGLYLLTRDAEHKFWCFRYHVAGKMREAGLGPAVGPGAVSLAKAREKARAMYELVRDGRDPLAERKAAKLRQKVDAATAAARGMTFDDVAAVFLAENSRTWRNAQHQRQWERTLKTYASPVFGALPIGVIDKHLVASALKPIWLSKAETASRLRGRIEQVIDLAIARDFRQGDNPARLSIQSGLLPKRSDADVAVKHHAALAYRDVPKFMTALAKRPEPAARALAFLILTAGRTGEVLGARWSEIDLEARLWVVPASRMKSGREHKVPLSDGALAILQALHAGRGGQLVFAGLSEASMPTLLRRMEAGATVHGFRSSFRDWAGDETGFPREVCEAALAHAVGDAVEQAYLRSGLPQKRRELMAAWDRYCRDDAPAAGVIQMRGAR
jgi:integrase